MALSLLYGLILLGSLQGLLVGGIILFAPYFRGRANRYLALSLIVVGQLGINEILYVFLHRSGWFMTYNDWMWEFLFPAAFFLYFVHALAHPWRGRPGLTLAVCAPFLLTALINLFIDLETELGVYDLGLSAREPALETYYFWEEVAVLVFALLMSGAAAWVIRRSGARKRWFWQFWGLATFVMLAWVVIWVLDLLGTADLYPLLWTGIAVLFFWISYRGLLQFRLAEDRYEIRIRRKTDAPPGVEQPPSDNPYLQRLRQWVEEEHGYRDQQLSRDKLAERLGISSGYLSQQLSQGLGLSFTDYINQFRVEDVKRMLLDADFDEYSLLAIGLEAGFNSKSTFYVAFKKATGQTPSAFRARHR